MKKKTIFSLCLLSCAWGPHAFHATELPTEAQIATCFDSSPQGKTAAVYLRAQFAKAELKPYLKHFCDPVELAQRARIAAAAGKVRIDGSMNDWPTGHFSLADARGNVVAHDKTKKPTGATGDIDILKVAIIYNQPSLFIAYETAAPKSGDASYWLHVYDAEGRQLYDFVFSENSSVNLYTDGKYTETRTLNAQQVSFSAGKVIEVSLQTAGFELPATFKAMAVAFSHKRNLVNATTPFLIESVLSYAQKSPAKILSHLLYTPAKATDTLSLAIALSEAFAYENGTAEVRQRVLRDAVVLRNYAAQRAPTFSQTFLTIPFEALLAWANRSIMWGGLGGLYLDPSGKINTEAYDFMFLNPMLLDSVRVTLEKAGVDGKAQPQQIAAAIDKFALTKNRYRWKSEEVCRWAKTYPDRPDYKQLCEDSKRDEAGNGGKLLTINGQTIYIWSVMGPNYQWNSVRNKDFFYGPCGDVAVVTMVGLKAFGIPEIGFYRTFGKTDDLVHTFTGFFDSQTQRWKSIPNQLPPENQQVSFAKPYLQFSLPIASATMPTWSEYKPESGAAFWITARSPVQQMSLTEMKKKLQTGFSNTEIRNYLVGAENTK